MLMAKFVVLLCRDATKEGAGFGNDAPRVGDHLYTNHWCCGPFDYVDEAKDFINTIEEPLRSKAQIFFMEDASVARW